MKTITVVTDDREGLLADVTSLLAGRDINIENIGAHVVGEMGVIVMAVDRYDLALQVLRDASYDAVTEDAIMVRVKDEPGALAKVAQRFTGSDVSLRSMRIIRRQQGWGLVAISADRMAEAAELVKDLSVSEEWT